MKTTPIEIETSRTAVRIQSCNLRRSTASREGVRKSRRPATRASCRISSLTVDDRQYQATAPEDDEELRTPYLQDDRLDLSAWARDAVALALPDQILCREDCAGLCPVCGRDLNVEPHEHEDEGGDDRWAKLAELRDRLSS